ncbi:MAG TPA: HD domain-containing protein, partial [Bacteroidetes bacterium]|nr:HD domain-containing protein [Bacteroidota bacterium]
TRDDHPFIDSLEVGDRFDGYFVLRTLQLASTRANKPYLILDLTDRTGHIRGKLWEEADVAYRALKPGEVVKVRAMAEEYLGRIELKVLRIRPVATEDVGDMSRFLPTREGGPEEDWEILHKAIEAMEHPGLKALLSGLFEDESFRADFEVAPAGKRWHHGYLGGLLEHTASMVKLAARVVDHYRDLDRDILTAGAILHDVGKLRELRYDTAIDYTTAGRLVGHIVLGDEFVREHGRGVEGLDEETLTRLRHLVLSHQGMLEYGSPVKPMTREAIVLYFLDELDSKLNAVNRELAKAEGGGGEFTEYIPLLERMLYKGPQRKDEEGGGSKAAPSPGQ